VAPPEGRVFGRPGNRQALNRAYHFLDLSAKRRDEVGFDFVCCWHKADMPVVSLNAAFGGKADISPAIRLQSRFEYTP
jgi:hypothetical protein